MPLITVEKTKKYLVLKIPLGAVEQKGQKIIDEPRLKDEGVIQRQGLA